MQRILVIFLGFLGLFIIGSFVAPLVISYSRSRVVDATKEHIVMEEEKEEKQARDDVFGGNTPGESIRLFGEAVGKRNVVEAQQLVVLSLREKVAQSLAEASEEDLLITSQGLLEAADQASSVPEGAETYHITRPANLLLMRYPSGNWKIASF